MYVQLTSSDVAESLGLVVGRYEYVEKQKEENLTAVPSVNTSATVSPGADMTADLSCCVETGDASLPDYADKDGTNTMLAAPVDQASYKLQPACEVDDSHLASNDAATVEDCEAGCISSADTQPDAELIDDKMYLDQPVVTAAESEIAGHADLNRSTGVMSHDL